MLSNLPSKRALNRIAIPLPALEARDTTLQYFQLQKRLKSTQNNIKFLKKLNAALTYLCLCALVYTLAVAIRGIEQPDAGFQQFEIAGANNGETRSYRVPESAGLAALQELISRRNLFEPSVASVSRYNDLAEAAKSELLHKFRIVGIIIADAPQAIIEVLSDNETVFVGEGERIEGALINRIDEDKITVVYNEIELELNR